MISNPEAELLKATASTFEELGFMFPAPEMEEQNAAAEYEAGASVEFKGPFNGRMTVKIYGKMLGPLAANMLGQDEPPSDRQQQDALGEMTNIICGNVLPKLAGNKAVFNIDAPQSIGCQEPCCCGCSKPAASISVSFDDGRADVTMFAFGDI